MDNIIESIVPRASLRKSLCFCLETIPQPDILKNRGFLILKNAELCSGQIQKQILHILIMNSGFLKNIISEGCHLPFKINEILKCILSNCIIFQSHILF